ncbi:glycoside hydrolase family 26 protein [Massilia sp. IC2-477]|uniref:glycosyl hydrolase n=1 Tax=Massilia sp. IC2-477 TaxID=2887198 RepID=UPI001D1017D9|nr:glycoside hydrolase family 26 protein [Massilia sp. IC2-477]
MNARRQLLKGLAALSGAAASPALFAAAAAPRLSNPQASSHAQAVHAWLHGIWGRQVIAGQQDLTWNDRVDMAQRVFDDTGKYPALMGYDFMNTGMSAPDASGLHQVEEAIAFARRGGLVSFCWHWRDPALLGTARVNRANFYVREPDAGKNTGFTIPMAKGQLDTASAAYRQLNAGIDLVAAQLRRLRDAGVTVLWRPLHEASGHKGDGWFWWGRQRSDGESPARANVELWRHMYRRMTGMHGLHNLIWVWNGQDETWYPGDDVVDIVGWDIYDDSDRKRYGAQAATYRRALAIGREAKPVALTETSYIPDPDKMLAEGAPWLWFTVWNDANGAAGVADKTSFWTGDYYNTAEHKNKVYHHPKVITLDKLPAFLKAPP